MPQLHQNKFINFLMYVVVPVAAIALMNRCWHRKHGFPITVENQRTGEKECRIVCNDCGASALYDPIEFKRVGSWEKVRPIGQKQRITPHAYGTA